MNGFRPTSCTNILIFAVTQIPKTGFIRRFIDIIPINSSIHVHSCILGMAYNGMHADPLRGKIAGMTKSELQELYENDAQIQQMVRESSYIADLEATKKRLIESNRKIAKESLELEPELSKTKANLIEAHLRFTEALKSYTKYKSKLGTCTARLKIC